MKKLLLITFAFANIAHAETFDSCYVDARNKSYNIKDASTICRGLVGDSCYNDAKRLTNNLIEAADVCRNVVSDVCYDEAKKVYNIKMAANICRGLVNNSCYKDARINALNIQDSVYMCRAGVVCEAPSLSSKVR